MAAQRERADYEIATFDCVTLRYTIDGTALAQVAARGCCRDDDDRHRVVVNGGAHIVS